MMVLMKMMTMIMTKKKKRRRKKRNGVVVVVVVVVKTPTQNKNTYLTLLPFRGNIPLKKTKDTAQPIGTRKDDQDQSHDYWHERNYCLPN